MSVKRDSKCHFSQIQSIHHISSSPMAKCWLFLLMCLLPLQALAAFSGAANAQPVAGLSAHAGMAHCHADSNSVPAANSDCGRPGSGRLRSLPFLPVVCGTAVALAAGSLATIARHLGAGPATNPEFQLTGTCAGLPPSPLRLSGPDPSAVQIACCAMRHCRPSSQPKHSAPPSPRTAAGLACLCWLFHT